MYDALQESITNSGVKISLNTLISRAPERILGRETMRRFGARYIYGQPSAVFKVCQVMDELGLEGRDVDRDQVR